MQTAWHRIYQKQQAEIYRINHDAYIFTMLIVFIRLCSLQATNTELVAFGLSSSYSNVRYANTVYCT